MEYAKNDLLGRNPSSSPFEHEHENGENSISSADEDLDQIEDKASIEAATGRLSAVMIANQKVEIDSLDILVAHKLNFLAMFRKIPSGSILSHIARRDSNKNTMMALVQKKILPEVGTLLFSAYIGDANSAYQSVEEADQTDSNKRRVADYLLLRFFFSHQTALILSEELGALPPKEKITVLSFLAEGLAGVSVQKTALKLQSVSDDQVDSLLSTGAILRAAATQFVVYYPDMGKKVKDLFTTFQYK